MREPESLSCEVLCYFRRLPDVDFGAIVKPGAIKGILFLNHRKTAELYREISEYNGGGAATAGAERGTMITLVFVVVLLALGGRSG